MRAHLLRVKLSRKFTCACNKIGGRSMFQHTYQENTRLYRGDRQLHVYVYAPTLTAQQEGYVYTYTSRQRYPLSFYGKL